MSSKEQQELNELSQRLDRLAKCMEAISRVLSAETPEDREQAQRQLKEVERE